MNEILLAGLQEQSAFWSYLRLLCYLALLWAGDGVFGVYASRVAERSEPLTLPRSGYKKWVRRAQLRSSLCLLPLMAAVTGLSYLLHPELHREVLVAAGYLTLNLLTFGNVLLLLALLTRNGVLCGVCCLFAQFASMLFSQGLPPAAKLLLPGNWGMALRTTLADPEGIPYLPPLMIEAVLLAALWLFGWRILKQYRRVKT